MFFKSIAMRTLMLVLIIAVSLGIVGCDTITGSKDVPPEKLTGKWVGVLTITDFAQEIVDLAQKGDSEDFANLNQGCAQTLVALKDQPLPMTVDIKANPDGTGTMVIDVDIPGTDNQKDESEPSKPIPFKYANNKITIDQTNEGSQLYMEASVSDSGDVLILDGTFKVTTEGKLFMEGTWNGKK